MTEELSSSTNPEPCYCDECGVQMADDDWVVGWGLCNECWKKQFEKDKATLPLPFSE